MKKKTWIRYIVLLLALAMTFSLFACGDRGNGETTAPETSEPTETESETFAGTFDESESEIESDTTSDTMSESGSETTKDTVSETMFDTESETVSVTVTETESETATDFETETVTVTETDTKSEDESDTESDTEFDTEFDTESETESEDESEDESETESEEVTETESWIEFETATEAESETKSETESGTGSVTETETVTEFEKVTGTDTETEPDDETEDGYVESPKILYVSEEALTVFKIPSIAGKKLSTLVFGDKVNVICVNTYSGWYKIRLDGEGYGYIPSDSQYFTETDPKNESDTEGETEGVGPETPGCEKCSFKSVKGVPVCKVCGFVALCRGEHDYASNSDGHWKPACEHCGKEAGKVQNHEYDESVEDGGDSWIYSFVCKICNFAAYEQEVHYGINAFYAPGDLAAIDTANALSGNFTFEMGTGFAGFTKSSKDNGTLKLVENAEIDGESGRYLVMKVRLPSSQSGFSVSVRSTSAANNFRMVFEDLRPGWVTIIADMTTAVSAESGYLPTADGEYYLSYLGIDIKAPAEERFDIAYVMLCSSIDDAEAFAANEKQVYEYTNVAKNEREFTKRACVDANGNEIKHTFVSDEHGHTVENACYQCGLAAVVNEAHSFVQMRVDGILTYACAVCEYLEYGSYLNKYFSAEALYNSAETYYRVDKSLIDENGCNFVRFNGKGGQAQVIFARNNYASSESEEAAAFPVGNGHLLIVRMRTNVPAVMFRLFLSTIEGKEKEIVIPASLMTVISDTDADSVEYGWTTYVIDLPRAIPSVFIADGNDEYKMHNFYLHIGTGSGEVFSPDVYFDFDFIAFVNSWDGVKNLVVDETVVKVNATNNGTLVKTQEQKCIGIHSYGEEVDGNIYTYACANCGSVLKSVTVPDSTTRYFSGYEIARNAVSYDSSAGSRDVIAEEEDIFGRVRNYEQIWWMRDQKDFSSGGTGAALNGRTMDVGQAKYLVIRLKTDNTAKGLTFYISTTGKNGTPRTEEEVTETKPITVPTTSGYAAVTSPLGAATVNEWITFVFDLETLIPQYYVKDSETGSYVIDTFGFWYSNNYDLDLDFMAFVEGGWEEIDAITPDDEIVYVTHPKNKTYSVLQAATGKCLTCSYAYTSVENNNGSSTYKYSCSVCGTIAASHNVSAGVNKYYALNTFTKYGGIDNGIMGENGVVYRSYGFAGKTGHIYVNAANTYTDIGADTGGVLVLKYRASGEANVQIEIGTEDRNVLGGGTANSVDGDVSMYVLAAKVSTEWCVMVINLSEFNYSVDSGEKVQVRITTSSESIDIAYIAIVDDEAEANELINETLDSTYKYYCGPKASAEIKNTTKSEIETETESESVSETEFETVTETETETATETDSETVAETESEAVTESETETVKETESEAVTETETESETVTEIEDENNYLDTIIFGNGGDVTSAGHSIADGAFALIEHTINKADAIEKSAEEIKLMLADKDSMVEGMVYLVKDPIVLDSNTKYYGNYAAIIAEGGIVVKGAENILIKDLILEGSVIVQNSKGIILFRTSITSRGVGVTVDAKCRDISIKGCRIVAADTAIVMKANVSTVYQNYLSANKGIVSFGDDMAVQENAIVARSLGIFASGDYCTVKNNTVRVSYDGIAISFDGAYNGLIALNELLNAQVSLKIKNSYNCSVILNRAIRIKGSSCTNLYIVDNKLGGAIELHNNNYLICDGNTFSKDGKTHPVVDLENTNFNGDNMHDVDARLEAGADENLLPHTNKDLFLGMERRPNVRDVSLPQTYSFNNYIRNMAKNDKVVILPPGAYSISSTLNLGAAQSYTTVYAYGVYQESTEYIKNIGISGVSSIAFKGLTIGYAGDSAGQIQVLDKVDKRNMVIRVVLSAGFNTDLSKLFAGGTGGGHIFHSGSYIDWTQIGNWGSFKVVANEDGSILDDDGSFKVKLTGSDAPKYYSVIEEGDIISWRLNVHGGGNGTTVGISNSKDVLFKDTVTYGYTNALVFVVSGTTTGMRLERHHNLAHSASEIDKETYDRYVALEKKYSVDLEVHIDDEGRYRGINPRLGSLDATHIGGSSEGLSATSTLFENGADDATNQRGYSSCLHEVIDNGDGTLTLRYKDYMAETYYHQYIREKRETVTPGFQAANFAAGDRIFVYASNGKVFCDTTVLTATEKVASGYVIYEETYKKDGQEYHLKWLSSINEVKVRKSDVNMDALDGYELGISSISMDTKIILDNISRNSMNFTLDNCMLRNMHGRVLIKTRNATVKNCTWKDTSMGGVVMSVETTWGESSVPMNVTIDRCLFDGVGQQYNSENQTKRASIAIEGLGAAGVETILSTETIPCKNITITNNVFRNGPNNYYITVLAAQGVTISNNVFETRKTETAKKVGKAIYFSGCMNVNISDNTYSKYADGDVTKVVVGNKYIGLTGSDVEGVLEKDKLPETE